MMTEVLYIDIHTHHAGRDGDVFRVLANTEPQAVDTPFSAGIHPQDVNRLNFNDFLPVWEDPLCLAVGECGLDRRHLAETGIDKQTDIFRKQALEAEKRNLPLIVHAVRMVPELLRLKKELAPTAPWILHGFRGNERKCMEMIDSGFYLSFGEGLLRDAGNMESFFARIPRGRIFFETDAAETDIRRIYALAASMMSMSVKELSETVKDGFRKVFRYDPEQ